MKNYCKPVVFTNMEIKYENLCMASGDDDTKKPVSKPAVKMTFACHASALGKQPLVFDPTSPICWVCPNKRAKTWVDFYCGLAQ